MKNFSLRLIIVLIFCTGVLYGAKTAEEILQEDGLYANIETDKGDMLVTFTFKLTPLHVCNFVGLAEGTLENDDFDPGEPFFDGLTFHRVAFDRVIQSGCPQGTGTGGPGYEFQTEIVDSLKHDRRGAMGMALSSPGSATAGSQWYLTHLPLPELDGDYTVFGYVEDSVGLEVIMEIREDDIVNKVTIIRVGIDAEKFKTDQETFDNLLLGITDTKDKVEQISPGRQLIIRAAKGKVSCVFNTSGIVDIGVYTINGRELFVLPQQKVLKGVFTLPFNCQPGMYLITIRHGNTVTTEKVVVQGQ